MPAMLPGYQYDIFISYRHNDNRSGWVTEFVNALQDELAATLKDPVSIYFDSNPHDGLHETHDVDGSLKEKVKCLVFIPIVSQTYCDPKAFAWQKEFLPFLEFTKQDPYGLDVPLPNGNVSKRVLPVRIHEIDQEDKSLFEEHIDGVMRPVDFIYKETGVNRPLEPDDSEDKNLNGTKYRNQVNKVANGIKDIIAGIKPVNDDTNSFKDPQREKIQELRNIGVNHSKRKTRIGITTVLVLALLAIAYFFTMGNKSEMQTSVEVEKSIAVLAFQDMSPNKDQEYFCDGISEEIINALVKIPDLKVSGRTSSFSFKGTNVNMKQIGEELDVKNILEGSIRKSGNKIRITAQLINAEDGFHLWSETYERDLNDIFAVQDEITNEIINALNLHLSGNASNKESYRTENLEAYNLYLQARQNLRNRGDNLIEAVKLFEESIKLDPAFAPAYSGLATTYAVWDSYLLSNEDIWQKGKAAANKAISLDPNNGEAYAALGRIFSDYEWDWAAADIAFEKAFALNPMDAEINNFAGDYYRLIDTQAALEMESKTIELDPLQYVHYYDLLISYFDAGLWQKVIDYGEEISQMKSLTGFEVLIDRIPSIIGNAHVSLGQLDQAEEIFNNLPQPDTLLQVNLMIAKGNRSEALTFVENLPEGYVEWKLYLYLKLGMDTKASEFIEEAYEQKSWLLISNFFTEEDYTRLKAETGFDKPELNALFERRRKSESLINRR